MTTTFQEVVVRVSIFALIFSWVFSGWPQMGSDPAFPPVQEAQADYKPGWGVVAFNTNKSVYRPGEEASMQIAVLDEEGKTLCDSEIEITIRNQSTGNEKRFSTEHTRFTPFYNFFVGFLGKEYEIGRIWKSDDTCTKQKTDVPDYTAHYLVNNTGIYDVAVTVTTKNGTYAVADQFEVKEFVPFEIERNGPTRIYPPEDYDMTFSVKANQDFKGRVTERIPEDFAVKPVDAAFTKTLASKNLKEVTWEVDWKAGETYELTYAFNAPNISPEYYLLGPLTLGPLVIGDFEESRQWQVAGDQDYTPRTCNVDGWANDPAACKYNSQTDCYGAGTAPYASDCTVDACEGTGTRSASSGIEDMGINGTTFLMTDTATTTVTFGCYNGTEAGFAVAYDSGSGWTQLYEVYGSQCAVEQGTIDIPIDIDDVEGTHYVRALVSSTFTQGWTCASGDYSDNDDMSFEVISGAVTGVSVDTTGSQTTPLTIPSSSQHVGGAFVFTNSSSTVINVTSISIVQKGTVDGLTELDNIELYYDLDTSNPYDCADETYGGGESQFGSTDTTGFSAANGTSTFTGSSISVSSTQAMCIYTVLDVLSSADDGDTIEIQIDDPSSDVSVTSGTAAPDSPVAIPGTTVLQAQADLQQQHYRWRNDNGGESGGIDAGDGADGALSLSGDFNLNTQTSATYPDGVAYRVGSIGGSTIALRNAASSSLSNTNGIAAGDEILLINLQGSPGDQGDVGNYEFLEVQSVSGGMITVASSPTNSYDGRDNSYETQKVFVQRVPNYTNVTTNAYAITAGAWDGALDHDDSSATDNVYTGIVVLRASGTVTVSSGGSIDVDGLGYRGGDGGPTGNAATGDGGINGESYDGSGRTDAGDGGNDTISGATGGAIGTRGGGSSSNIETVTPLAYRGGGGGGGNCDGNAGTDGAGGGGGGGYGSSAGAGGGGGDENGGGGAGGSGGTATGTTAGGGGGSPVDNTTGGPGGSAGNIGGGDWPGSAGSGTSTGQGGGGGASGSTGMGAGAGGGGGTYGTETLTSLFLGSGGGGGGGHDNDAVTGYAGRDGGDGGGIVYIAADTITVVGSVSGNGENGVAANADGGASGGGSGGSIYLATDPDNLTLGSSLVTTTGGSTGAAGVTTDNAGGGGGGGVGRIRVESDNPSGTTNPSASLGGSPASGAGATFLLAEDIGLAGFTTASTTRLRFLISNEGGQSNTSQYRLEVAQAATCSSGSFGQILTDYSGHWNIATSTYITDGENTSNISPGLSDPAGAFTQGQLKDTSATTSNITVSTNQFTEIEYTLEAVDGNAVGGAQYCFRLTDAGSTSLFTYSIYATATMTAVGELTSDIVDSGGSPVSDPYLFMTTSTFSFAFQTATGTLGVSEQRVRVNNTTASAEWSLTIAANTTTAYWGGGTDYDFNDATASAGDGGDADSLGGQMTIDPSGGSIAPEGGCSETGLTLGSSASFNEGTTDSITLVTAGATADTSCYWDFTDMDVSQTIPAEQEADLYLIDLVVTVTAV